MAIATPTHHSSTDFGSTDDLVALADALRRTAVIIPARNEAASLPLVLADLPEVGVIVVADNGSTDETASIASNAGCKVVREPVAGYGRACLAGMAGADRLASQTGRAFEFIAFVDADYSDHPEQLSRLLLPILHDEADFVLGSRMLGQREPGAMPPCAVWGNRLACWLMRRIWGAGYTDLGPFRVIRRQRLAALHMTDTNFGWTIEMQVKALIHGLRVQEIPVRYRRRIGVSKISGTVSGTIRAGYKILFTIAKYAWQTRRN